MKHVVNSGAPVWGAFRRNESGATALSFALGLTVMLGAVGVGVDFSIVSKANKKAQNVADMAALNAAVFVRENDDEMPGAKDDDAFVHGAVYKAKDIGYSFGGLIEDDVKITVEYDMDKREATATVWGSTKTTFTNLLGHEKMPFSTSSTVKFLTNRITAPASVFIIADNSGSMAWHDKARFDVDGSVIDNNADTDGQPRITGLEDTVKTFMQVLYKVAGPQEDDDERVLRTGLVPYSAGILSTEVDRDWGYLTDAEIEAMEPNLSTNSSPPMARVKEWMDGEEAIHKAQHTLSPLRYVVFLTDGQNTGGTDIWVESAGGGVWTGQYCEMEEEEAPCGPDANGMETKSFEEFISTPTRIDILTDTNTGEVSYNVFWNYQRASETRYMGVSDSWWDNWVSNRLNRTNRRGENYYGYTDVTELCTFETERCQTFDAKTQRGSVDYNDVVRSETDPALDPDSGPSTNMVEGKFVYDFDWETVKTCNALRDDGVKVFSVGFALEAGKYKSNRVEFNRQMYDNEYEPSFTETEAANAFERANQLLKRCAYEDTDDYMMLASDTEALELAFSEIGKTISEEVVRVVR